MSYSSIIRVILLQPFILLLAVCAGTLSAQSQTSVNVSVGSSAVLHCDCKSIASHQLSEQSPYIKWKTTSQTVFERRGAENFQGEGYEGRVDVPEDELKKGNCSLVFKYVKAEDAGVYRCNLQVKRSKRFLQTKWEFIQRVELSVHEDSPVHAPQQQDNTENKSDNQDTPMTSSSAGLIIVPSQILMFTILTNILLHIM